MLRGQPGGRPLDLVPGRPLSEEEQLGVGAGAAHLLQGVDEHLGPLPLRGGPGVDEIGAGQSHPGALPGAGPRAEDVEDGRIDSVGDHAHALLPHGPGGGVRGAVRARRPAPGESAHRPGDLVIDGDDALLLFLAIESVAQCIYFVDFYRVFADYKRQRLREEKEIAERQTLPFDVSMLPEKAPQTLVVVIGESHTRHHMSLYGYGRDTNPLLSV